MEKPENKEIMSTCSDCYKKNGNTCRATNLNETCNLGINKGIDDLNQESRLYNKNIKSLTA